MRILTISDTVPYPPTSGGRIRTYNLLRRIAEKEEVWLAALLQTPEDADSISHLETFCNGVEAVPVQRQSPVAHLPGLLRYALKGYPLELKFIYSEILARRIRELVRTVEPDVVEIIHSEMALYLESLPPHERRRHVLTLQNIAFLQYDRIYRTERRAIVKARAFLHSRMMRAWEPRYAARFDRCITVSDADRDLLLDANPAIQARIVPNGVDVDQYQVLPVPAAVLAGAAPPSLLFVGTMNYPPGADAVLFFCEEVLPLIRRALGEVELWIVGREPPPEVRRLEGDGVHVTGWVKEVVPYYRQSAVCVVPLRAGGGTRLKILEAMALGRPVVSTSIGCEGLDVVDGQHLLVADDAASFAEQTIRLLTDRSLYERMVASARSLVVRNYDWDAIADRQLEVYAEALHQAPLEVSPVSQATGV
jgi:polysaccharide biosynthesis protein PslH